jgi:hypothetical protein
MAQLRMPRPNASGILFGGDDEPALATGAEPTEAPSNDSVPPVGSTAERTVSPAPATLGRIEKIRSGTTVEREPELRRPINHRGERD